MDENFKEVYFDVYCKTCEHEKLTERDEPCNECLAQGVNYQSHKPIKWKEKTR